MNDYRKGMDAKELYALSHSVTIEAIKDLESDLKATQKERDELRGRVKTLERKLEDSERERQNAVLATVRLNEYFNGAHEDLMSFVSYLEDQKLLLGNWQVMYSVWREVRR